MLFIPELKVAFQYNEQDIKKAIKQTLKAKEKAIYLPEYFYIITKESIDARKKQTLHKSLQIKLFAKNEYEQYQNSKIIKDLEVDSKDKATILLADNRPVIIGLGPSGLFAAYYLALAGQKPIIIEMGEKVEDRSKKVFKYWKKGELDNFSNVQFGEGGAGTFSDGKLVTTIKDDLLKEVLQSMVLAGADKEILTSAKPHIGTDKLPKILQFYRQKLLDLGADIYYRTELIDFELEELTGNFEYLQNENSDFLLTSCLKSIKLRTYFPKEKSAAKKVFQEDKIWTLPCKELILASGHSCRELYYLLARKGLLLEEKNTAIGVRMEHRQKYWNNLQYGQDNCQIYSNLPAAAYKLTNQTVHKRGVYSFCMCPGGMVVAASSNSEYILTNGMSRAKRNSKFANAALLVTTTTKDYQQFLHDYSPERLSDFKINHTGIEIIKKWYERVKVYPALAGIYLQTVIEVIAKNSSAEKGYAIAQTAQSFINENDNSLLEKSRLYCCHTNNFSYRPGITPVNLHDLLPKFICENLKLALIDFSAKFDGFMNDDVLLIGPETRSSSPLRIIRHKNLGFSSCLGIFPAGEGAGYAGGISSSAVDGVKQAKKLLETRRIILNRLHSNSEQPTNKIT